LAEGQGGNDDTSPDNIFEKFCLMGSATATNEGGAVSMHRSLQSISDSMLAMKRGLDSITGKSDENKRAKISLMQADNADDGSFSTSDVKDNVDTYLQTCQPGGPQKGTIRGKKPIWPITSLKDKSYGRKGKVTGSKTFTATKCQ